MVCEAVADVSITTKIMQDWMDVNEDQAHVISTTQTTFGESIKTTTTINVQLSKSSSHHYTCTAMYAGVELGEEVINLYNYITPEPYIRLESWTAERVRHLCKNE